MKSALKKKPITSILMRRVNSLTIALLLAATPSLTAHATEDDIALDMVPIIAALAQQSPAPNTGIDFGTVIKSSNLGWVAGQNVSSQLVSLFSNNVLKPGHTLLLEAMFEIDGSVRIQAPENFVLAGSYFGAGFTIRNTEQQMRDPWLRLQTNSVLYNVSILHRETLPLPTQPGITLEGKSNTRSIAASGDNIKIINSYFTGNTGIFIDAGGSNHLIKNSHFDSSTTQLRGSLYIDAQIIDSLFENALGDGIKTIRPRSGELGTENPLVSGCVFLNNRRDGIDTTGGFRNATVTDSYFIKLFKGLDIKNIYDENTRVFANPALQSLNNTIRIERCEFVDANNGVASITLDRGPSGSGNDKWIDNSRADDWLTQNIQVTDSIFEGGNNALLSQDVHTVSWNNIELFGSVNMSKVSRNPGVSTRVDPSVNTNYGINGGSVSRLPARSAQPDSFYRSLAGPDQSLQLSL